MVSLLAYNHPLVRRLGALMWQINELKHELKFEYSHAEQYYERMDFSAFIANNPQLGLLYREADQVTRQILKSLR